VTFVVIRFSWVALQGRSRLGIGLRARGGDDEVDGGVVEALRRPKRSSEQLHPWERGREGENGPMAMLGPRRSSGGGQSRRRRGGAAGRHAAELGEDGDGASEREERDKGAREQQWREQGARRGTAALYSPRVEEGRIVGEQARLGSGRP
jgi:hypothetical protein